MSDEVANADLVFSTIHSAKGLEFDNVIVLYKNEASLRGDGSLDEDQKRMYYVAFTRAMNSELILAYGTHVNPRIMGDWAQVHKALLERDAQAAAAAAQATSGDGSV